MKEMETRRLQAQQRKMEEEKARAQEEERKLREEAERRKREREDQTDKRPIQSTLKKVCSLGTIFLHMTDDKISRKTILRRSGNSTPMRRRKPNQLNLLQKIASLRVASSPLQPL